MGVIALEFVDAVEPVGKESFRLVSSEKTYYLMAPDAPTAERWIAAIEKARTTPAPAQQSAAGGAAAALSNGGTEWQRKSGWLEKHGGGFSAQWSKMWVVMKGGVLYTFKKPGQKQRDKVPLYKATLDEYKPHKYNGITFMVTTNRDADSKKGKPAEVIFRCQDQEEMHSWLNTLLRQKLAIEATVDNITLDDTDNGSGAKF